MSQSRARWLTVIVAAIALTVTAAALLVFGIHQIPSSSVTPSDLNGPALPEPTSQQSTSAEIRRADSPQSVRPAHESLPRLIAVSISPEARVKATANEGRRELRAGQWSEFSITIDNAAGITSPLIVESQQLMTSTFDTARDRWLSLELVPSGPLTGEPTENRKLRLRSRDEGIRTAILNINAGQGTQDLGFRSDVVISFSVKNANPN